MSTSRDIIRKTASEYGWQRRPLHNVTEMRHVGDDDADVFHDGDALRPFVLVFYAANGRVLDLFVNSRRQDKRDRNAVLDLLEAR